VSGAPLTASRDRFDERAWTVATWSSPILFQAVCGMFLAAMLVAGKLGMRDNDHIAEGHKILAAATAAVALSLVIAGLLARPRHTTWRGLAAGLATSAIIFGIGTLGYVLWLS
jgi:uncharacterized membrane protein